MTYNDYAITLNRLFGLVIDNNKVSVLFKNRELLWKQLNDNNIDYMTCNAYEIIINPHKNNNYNIVLEGIKCSLI